MEMEACIHTIIKCRKTWDHFQISKEGSGSIQRQGCSQCQVVISLLVEWANYTSDDKLIKENVNTWIVLGGTHSLMFVHCKVYTQQAFSHTCSVTVLLYCHLQLQPTHRLRQLHQNMQRQDFLFHEGPHPFCRLSVYSIRFLSGSRLCSIQAETTRL